MIRTRSILQRFASVLLAVGAFLAPAAAGAQPRPDLAWRTLRTSHFRVHYPAPLDSLARRAAGEAERAYAGLARELVAPRGPIDLVVSDDADYSNGWATPVPSNRIVIFANPPIDAGALRFTDDWLQLVVTHELTHIFHLDRARGIWRVGQGVFGRAPFLFPNSFAPSWLTEGLAVYYETRLTGSGRLAGTAHRTLARVAAASGHLPRLDELSLATPRFPMGDVAYGYGSLFIDYLAQRGGPGAVRTLVERSSAQLVPIVLASPGRNAFGVSYAQAWRDWRDSLVRHTDPAIAGPPLPGWRDLTPWGFLASYPRWMGDTSLTYVGATPRDPYAAWRVDLSGRRERLGRRNSRSPQVPLRDGGLLYAQLDFTNPYQVRADLYVARDGHEHRLTRGARLVMPDARADGGIVAVEIAPGSTRLVRVEPDGSRIRTLASTVIPSAPRDLAPAMGSIDEQWSDPRWSPDGTRIAAVHWARGIMSIVVLDSSGVELQRIGGARAVLSTPSWSPDGRTLFYVTDVSGAPTLARVAVDGGATRLLGGAGAPLAESAVSPDGARIAATAFEWDGYHVGVAPLAGADAAPARAPGAREGVHVTPAPAPAATGDARAYSPWRTLLPRYWMPTLAEGISGYRLGALTSGSDVVGRHAFVAQLGVPLDRDAGGLVGGLGWRYAGLGQPLVDLAAYQDWEARGGILNRDRTARIGTLLRRTQDASAALTVRRPRYRTYASVSAGAGYERRLFATTPDSLLPRLRPEFRGDTAYPRLFVSGTWGNAYRTAYGISPENGIGVNGTVLQRWAHGTGGAPTRTYIGVGTGYRALPLPGFANHVLAARLAGGWSDANATRALEVGGTSGSPISLVPGVALGEGYRTFPVRGFAPASLFGTRVATGSLEYRAPLVLPARGLGLLPFFLDRTSATIFADGGVASCGRYIGTACPAADSSGGRTRSIASVGAELTVSAAVLNWDAPYRFRLGAAVPVKGREETGAKPVSWYFTAGLSF